MIESLEPRHGSILDLEDAPLLQIVHLFEDQSHVVPELLEFRHRHLKNTTRY